MRGFHHSGRLHPGLVLAISSAATAGIAALDWLVEPNVALGFLYFFPLLFASLYLPRWSILGFSILYTGLRQLFSPVPLEPFGVFNVLASYLGTGLFVSELARNRRLAVQHLREITNESERRKEAEEQSRVVIESSPAAIVLADGECRVLLANEAAHRLLRVSPGALAGRRITEFIPALQTVPAPLGHRDGFRTTMECRGERSDGEVFLASVWFSTYRTAVGPRLAAIVNDTSEELRDREEFSLSQMLASGRILMGAVSHEIRNFCSAIGVIYTNLARNQEIVQSEDFRALGTMVQALDRISSTELRNTLASERAEGVDLGPLLDELRIVIEPPLLEAGVRVLWEMMADLPLVWADRESLLQVFLNLAKNSGRAMEDQETRELRVATTVENGRVIVRFRDTGRGVPVPDRLFEPYQHGAEATGLGLYISRALVRAFQGELRHEPQSRGCCFAVELPVARLKDRRTAGPVGTAGLHA